jgi:hypothetical protein
MADIREDILVRLLALAGEVDGIETAARNVLSFDDDEIDLPGAAILDGTRTQ